MAKGMRKEKSVQNIRHLENSKVMCFMIVEDLVSISTIRNRFHTVSGENSQQIVLELRISAL